MKCVVGALLLVVPVVHFFAFGYLYSLIEQGRRGDAMVLPEWGDWRRLFTNGVVAFVIFLGLTVLPLVLAWVLVAAAMGMLKIAGLLAGPLPIVAYNPLIYLPIVVALMLSGPLTAAGIYQYQKRGEYADAFRVATLAAMLRSSRARFWVPTFALMGFLVVGYPLMTFTVFVALAASWSYYGAYYRFVEESRKRPVRP